LFDVRQMLGAFDERELRSRNGCAKRSHCRQYR
jgi:hypothetical protein